MLVRSSSTPVLGALHASSGGGGHSPAVHFADSSPTVAYHPPAISCSLSSAGGGGGSDHERSRGSTGGGGLRRACSDGNLSSLGGRADDHHRSRPAPLETIQSFAARDGSCDEEEDDDDFDEDADQEMSFGMFGSVAGTGSTYTQEHPLFLARGLGIDRLGSGLLLTADDGGINDGTGNGAYLVASGGGGDRRSGIEAHYKQLIEGDPCNGLFLRNYARFLYQVKGDRRRAEEYYSRAILADPDDGELLSEYARLVWEVHGDEDRASGYFERAARADPHNSHVLAAQAAFLWDTDDGAGPGRDREPHGVRRRRCSVVHGFRDDLNLAAAVTLKLTLIGVARLLASVLPRLPIIVTPHHGHGLVQPVSPVISSAAFLQNLTIAL